MKARLYGILDCGYVDADRAPAMVRMMVDGGVAILQLRAKNWPKDRIVELGTKIAPLCRDSGVPFIINDHVDLVDAVGADGVHVGQDDLPIADVRRIVGDGRLIGRSTHSLDQALKAEAEKVDYIGYGPIFATPTKPDYVPVGLDEVAAVHAAVKLPIFCIGGIKRENLGDVVGRGAQRVVVVSGILLAPDPAAYCRDLVAYLASSGPAV